MSLGDDKHKRRQMRSPRCFKSKSIFHKPFRLFDLMSIRQNAECIKSKMQTKFSIRNQNSFRGIYFVFRIPHYDLNLLLIELVFAPFSLRRIDLRANGIKLLLYY